MKKTIVLIDFENVQPKDLGKLRGRSLLTKIFCGANQSKVPLDLAAELQPLGQEVEYVRIQSSGRNALDFHIAYYLGRLSVESSGAAFYVISKDTGFDPLIQHLNKHGISCQRFQNLGEVAKPTSEPAGASLDNVISKVTETVLNQKQAKPRRLKTLRAFIQAQLNHHASEPNIDAVLARLKGSGVGLLEDGNLRYP